MLKNRITLLGLLFAFVGNPVTSFADSRTSDPNAANEPLRQRQLIEEKVIG